MLHLLFGGAPTVWSATPDIAINTIRMILGIFFAISGYHKLFNAERHATVYRTLVADRVPLPGIMSWIIASAEFTGGLALIVGFMSLVAGIGLFIICLGATFLDGLKRIPASRPIDRADTIDDILYLPEILYCLALMVPIMCGPGSFSLDALVLRRLS